MKFKVGVNKGLSSTFGPNTVWDMGRYEKGSVFTCVVVVVASSKQASSQASSRACKIQNHYRNRLMTLTFDFSFCVLVSRLSHKNATLDKTNSSDYHLPW